MRYSARKRNIIWRDDALVTRAKNKIHEILMDDDDCIIRYKLGAGEGIISSNVLHRRTAFTDSSSPGTQRLLYRIRYFDSVSDI